MHVQRFQWLSIVILALVTFGQAIQADIYLADPGFYVIRGYIQKIQGNTLWVIVNSGTRSELTVHIDTNEDAPRWLPHSRIRAAVHAQQTGRLSDLTMKADAHCVALVLREEFAPGGDVQWVSPAKKRELCK